MNDRIGMPGLLSILLQQKWLSFCTIRCKL